MKSHHMTSVSPAVQVVASARLLRKVQPELPALELLDRSMRGRHGRRIDFGDLATPPSPFALIVAEAFDGGMRPCDWAGLLQSRSHPRILEVLMEVWWNEVWPKFVVRYSQY